jgi:hypothetical protein
MNGTLRGLCTYLLEQKVPKSVVMEIFFGLLWGGVSIIFVLDFCLLRRYFFHFEPFFRAKNKLFLVDIEVNLCFSLNFNVYEIFYEIIALDLSKFTD